MYRDTDALSRTSERFWETLLLGFLLNEDQTEGLDSDG